MISIIGAGPVGLYLAYKLAKSGEDVEVFEEHKKVGEPVQCTGIVSSEFSKVIDIDDKFLVNKLKKVKVFSRRKCVEIPINDSVIDRGKFDRYLFSLAKKMGVKVHTEKKYIGYSDSKVHLLDKKGKILKKESEVIVGADGPTSEVAKSNGIKGNNKFFVGLQARVKGNFDSDCFEVYLGSIAPGFFAWVVPESSTIARVGIAGRKFVAQRFLKFLKIKEIDKKNIIDKQGGLIPIYSKRAISRGNAYLVGDAAGQVKATTGGGLVPGLKAADVLADCIIHGKDYNKKLKKVSGEMNTHRRIRNILNKFNDKDYDNLIEMVNDRKVKKILESENRDMSSEVVVKMLLAKPSFIRYMTKIIQ